MPVTVVVRTPAPKAGARRGQPDGEVAPLALTFDAARVVIGRGDGCELRLPDESVSSRHASIRQKGTAHVIEDEGSTNGTYLGGQRLAPHAAKPLADGDLVRIGRVWIEIRFEAKAVPSPPQATKELALQLVSRALAGLGEDDRARIVCVDGPDKGKILFLDRPAQPYTVGRGHDVDLPIDEPDASRRHVQLTRKGEHLYVRDLGSKNGSQLGSKPDAPPPFEPIVPGRDVLVKPGVPLAIGKDIFLYENPAAVALAQLDRAADTKVAESDLPARPPSELPPEPASVTPPPVTALASGTPAPPPPAEATSTGPVASVAPVAQTPQARAQATPKPPTKGTTGKGWDASDFVIVLVALVVLGVSIAGLAMLFR